jgi:hypothetical protein
MRRLSMDADKSQVSVISLRTQKSLRNSWIFRASEFLMVSVEDFEVRS